MRSLEAIDPFFMRQTGPPPFCNHANMTQLSNLLIQHENLHWTEARSRAQQLHIQTVIEKLTFIPGSAGDMSGAIRAAIGDYDLALAAANAHVDSGNPVQQNAPRCNMRP